MCGRFENELPVDNLKSILQNDFGNVLLNEDSFFNNLNIAPTQKIAVIVKDSTNFSLEKMKWGIKYSDKSPLIFNSRIETIKEKQFWLKQFDLNRCIIPMTGFYEWKTADKKKIPYRIYLPEHKLFYVPGIFQIINNDKCVSLVTTVANTFMKSIHHRMPVILNNSQAKIYFTNSLENNLLNCLPLDEKILMKMEQVVLQSRD